MAALSCLHRGITRLKGEELLSNAKRDGSYLVRDSETVPGAYTLSLLYQGRVHQYRIIPDDEGKLHVQAEKGVQERKFCDLKQLIHEYVNRSNKNGLICALKYPVEVEQEEDKESDEEEDIESEKPKVERSEPIPTYAVPGRKHKSTSNPADKDEFDVRVSADEFDETCVSDGENQGADASLCRIFMKRFQQLDLSDCDGQFVSNLRRYVSNDVVKDAQASNSGETRAAHLDQLLLSATSDLEREMELFLAKIDMCRILFGPIMTSPLVSKKSANDAKSAADLNSFLERLSQCKLAICKLQKKATNKLQELSSTGEPSSQYPEVSTVPLLSTACKPTIPPAVFEARLTKHGKATGKVHLTVDIQCGKLFAIRPNKDILDESNVFTHDKILQLIKCTVNNCRLDIRIDGRKKESYIFDDVRQRENFSQLIQQLKNMHSMSKEVDQLSIFIGSWNMAEEDPPWNLERWLQSDGQGKTRNPTLSAIPHDLYVIGTQESRLTEKEWINRIKTCLCDLYMQDVFTVATISLWAIRLIVLVKTEYKNKITHVQTSAVKTGLGNALGNKGAVGVSFNFNRTSLCFVNAHLTSGHERNSKRNQNYRDIIKSLCLGPKNLQNLFDATNKFHHLFFFGDLNYRLEGMEPIEIIRKVTMNDYNPLLHLDQLMKSQTRKESFIGFSEEEITFPPTYRFEKGTTKKNYVWQKFKKTGVRINAPSWCDRVLWKSYPETYLVNTSYGCADSIISSDHKPVFATFDVGIVSQFVSAKGAGAQSGDIKILLEEIRAEVKTTSKEHFRIEFHSPCLEEPILSGESSHLAYSCGYCTPSWTRDFLPKLQPIFDEQDYLEDQHILIAVKSTDGMESFGECVLALKPMFGISPQSFESYLTHRGEETGKLSALVHVKAKDGSAASCRHRVRRSYEFIYMDTDLLKNPRDHLTLEMRHSAPPEGADSGSKRIGGHQKVGPVKSVTMEYPQSPSATGLGSGRHNTPTSENIYETDCLATGRDSNFQPPALPPRKPRMGQSSLVQSPVLPVVINSIAGSGASGITMPDIMEHTYADAEMEDDPMFNDPIYRDSALESEPSPTVHTPPSLPPRRYKQDDSAAMSYDTLKKPTSINLWLVNLGLPQYIQTFFDHGWDHVEFLADITDGDLKHMNIAIAEHRERILTSIGDMKNSTTI